MSTSKYVDRVKQIIRRIMISIPYIKEKVQIERNSADQFSGAFVVQPYMILPCIVCFVAMPLHEFLHAIIYPKGAKVYIGVSLKQLRAYAASSAALSRERYIMMSLAPLIPGIVLLTVFLVCPITMKWLMTICMVSSIMGLISPAPDYMDVLIILQKVPKGAMIQVTENGLVWYL
ncbi:MAG TPA: hypothetical protein DCR27_11960 [Lachnospiraceae bacterium]|nr:hypothetical protein [Lachnospiraceae bacterium]